MNIEAELQALAHENARLKNDLQTIATRVTHDLRTHLGGITTTGEILRETLLDKDPAAIAMVDGILNSAEDLSQLLKRISFVLKASASPIPKTLVAMDKAVLLARQKLERLASKNQATVIEPAAWPEVAGVPAWLEIIWWNLLRNALEHGGKSRRIELGWGEEPANIRFWIRDDGPGVAERIMPKLFQRFDTLYELNGARGFGLSIVQRLVELQNGETGYEFKPGRGNEFFFILPKELSPAQ